MNEASTTQTFRSRFGFHPCDYPTYRKLKDLHRWYWLTVRDFHAWWRWQRKQPQNRRGQEPAFCPVFIEDRPWRKRRKSHGQDAVRLYPMTLVDRGVLGWYLVARMPQAEPPGAMDEVALQEIERLHAEAAAWFDRP